MVTAPAQARTPYAQRCARPVLRTAVLALLALAGLIVFFGRWGYDDPYITYRYADNLLAGNGLVYNVGERTLSTTTASYALLLAGVGLLWPDLPAASNVLCALALVAGAILLFRLPADRGRPAVGLLAAVLFLLSPLLLMSFGSEMCLYVALILAGFYAYDRSRLSWAAAALAGAALIRPDGALAALALVAYHLIRRFTTRSAPNSSAARQPGRWPIPWQPLALYAAVLAAWYAGLALYYGSPFPVTLLAKQQQGQMGISVQFAPGLAGLLRDYARLLPLYVLHGLLALVGLGRVLACERRWLPLLLWTMLYFLAYSALGVSSYFWYYAPLVPAGVVLVAEGLRSVFDLLRRWLAKVASARGPALCCAVTGLLVIAVLQPPLAYITGLLWQPDSRLEIYRQAGHWLAANTPPQASVGLLEVGITGYYARRRVVDFGGLIQPAVARRLPAGRDYQDSAAWAIQTYRPDYVLLPRTSFAGLAAADWFAGAYQPVASLSAAEHALWLTIYQQRPGR